MEYKVQLDAEGQAHYIMGLPFNYTRSFSDPNTLLIYRYGPGDCDVKMTDAKMMLGALYDLYQCNDSLHEGDTFNTEFGIYECVGVHVIPKFTI